ncbi:hypothetical protein [Limnovirga soli]|uniref:Uncharacterized protein n=1 Tax=Limnovirga soli TaxID=2656915 RepID=A0A8J8FEJ4_9BACT|nr:hypothetical protein [Limnovirga soli]NNV56636.1 hypothetical protein [Limnovirga soli]
MIKWLLVVGWLVLFGVANAQDTAIIFENQQIILPEAIVHNNLDYLSILKRIKNDTSFYKAFRNLHIINYTAYNDISILNKAGGIQASWSSKTRQLRDSGCRTMKIVNETTTGDFFDKKGDYNYLTGEMYASIFLTKGKICGENNIVTGRAFNTSGKSGIQKHKEQLKMLFFNPGKKIPGIPFIGDKLDLYDDRAHKLYDYRLTFIDYKGSFAYVFSIKPKTDLGLFSKDDIVVDEMTTWFDYKTLEVLARNYVLSYNAGAYNFHVNMEAEMTRVGNLLVPQVLRYKGDFGVLFKKKERGAFTATLFDFKP